MNPLIQLRQLPGRRAHGAYLAVISVLVLCLLVMMGQAGLDRRERERAEREVQEARRQAKAAAAWEQVANQRADAVRCRCGLANAALVAEERRVQEAAADKRVQEAEARAAAAEWYGEYWLGVAIGVAKMRETIEGLPPTYGGEQYIWRMDKGQDPFTEN